MALMNLKGTRRQFTHAEFISHAKQVGKTLTKKVACTAAGDNGAINIWITDSGVIRVEAMRHLKSLETLKLKDISAAEIWARKWLKLIK